MSQDNPLLKDLLADDYFLEWVINPTPGHHAFWWVWLKEDPARAADLEKARQIILLVKYQKSEPAATAEKDVWEKVETALNEAEEENLVAVRPMYTASVATNASWFTRTRRLAASLIFLILTMGLGYYLLQNQLSNVPVALKKRVTPLGQRAVITLPDGTKVTLNAGSTLKYPISFDEIDQRRVFLQGEAFFQVVKNKEKPFVVNTQGVQVKVLGTSFNLKAYPEEEFIQTTLVEGKVELNRTTTPNTSLKGYKPLVMRPNQKADFSRKDGKTKLLDVDPQLFIAWTEGKLIFKNTPIREVIRVLNRTYNVNIKTANKRLEQCTLTADFTNLPLNQTVAAMCQLVEASFNQKNKEIIINGKGC